MNHYTELLYFIKGLADADPLVNSVTQGDFDRLDLDKMTIFPLVHISIGDAQFSNGTTVSFDIQLGAHSIRDINKEIRTDNFWLQDNEVDNLNEMLAVLNRLWSKIYRGFSDNDITTTENPTLQQTLDEGTNLLDGWILSFNVQMPNTTMSLCD
tara:strand:+ start:1211 stop:1672 length:462 start_codon:yes stop_codon:yes gene_type:complete